MRTILQTTIAGFLLTAAVWCAEPVLPVATEEQKAALVAKHPGFADEGCLLRQDLREFYANALETRPEIFKRTDWLVALGDLVVEYRRKDREHTLSQAAVAARQQAEQDSANAREARRKEDAAKREMPSPGGHEIGSDKWIARELARLKIEEARLKERISDREIAALEMSIERKEADLKRRTEELNRNDRAMERMHDASIREADEMEAAAPRSANGTARFHPHGNRAPAGLDADEYFQEGERRWAAQKAAEQEAMRESRRQADAWQQKWDTDRRIRELENKLRK